MAARNGAVSRQGVWCWYPSGHLAPARCDETSVKDYARPGSVLRDRTVLTASECRKHPWGANCRTTVEGRQSAPAELSSAAQRHRLSSIPPVMAVHSVKGIPPLKLVSEQLWY
jgi:hypothetical protein